MTSPVEALYSFTEKSNVTVNPEFPVPPVARAILIVRSLSGTPCGSVMSGGAVTTL